MKTLHTSQLLFSDVLDLKAIEDGIVAERFNGILRDSVRIPGRVAMGIYRNNSIGVRQQALQYIYPVVEKILGEQCFYMMAKDFVIASPSLNADLNCFGDGFADFLTRAILSHSTLADYNYLPDLARLEWRYHGAYYAPAAKQTAHLIYSRVLYYLSTDFPIYDIWQAHQCEDVVADVPVLIKQDHLIVYRQQHRPRVERVSAHELLALQLLTESVDIERTIETLAERGVDVQQLLPAMIAKGWLDIR